MFRSIFVILNYKTFIITILSLVATILCDIYNIRAEFPLNLVGIAIVFPVVFSIDSAYKRRERALAHLADFKAHVYAIYQASCHWLSPPNDGFTQNVKTDLLKVYETLRETFVHKKSKDQQRQLYRELNKLSKNVQQFRDHGLQVGEMSRVNQYVSKLEVAIENMLVILNYRTPITLRSYSRIFIYSFPVLYAPYFVAISSSYSLGLGYMMPIIFSFILVSLDNIQNHLEDPFDQIGEDDIKFDVEDFGEMMNS